MNRFALTITMILLAGAAAWAAAPADSTRRKVELDEVVVRAFRPYAEVIPSQRLEGKQLETLSGTGSVADAIRYFSGVQLKDYGGVGGIKTVDMRSMGSSHMGVFYDGLELGNAQNGQIDLSRFSLDNIEAIDLYNGQKSDILQPARDFGTSGSIYLRSRQPRFGDGKRTNVNVTVRTGSFGLFNPSVRLEQKLSKAVSLSASAEWTSAHGKYHFRYRKRFSDGTMAWDTTAVRRNGDVQALRVEAAVHGTESGGRWTAQGYYYDSNRGIPGAIVNNVWRSSQRQWDRNTFVQGNWQHRCNDRLTTLVSAKVARDWMRYLNPDTTLLYVDNRFTQWEAYASAAAKYTILTGWDASAAVDYRWNTLDATLANFARPTRHTLLAALATAFTRGGLKAQASMLLSHVADRYSDRSGDRVVASHVNRLDRLTPAVIVSYRPLVHTDLTLRAFFKRAFRMPTFNDLYYTDIGNASLKPEMATQWNVGAQYQWYAATTGATGITAVKLTADAYHNRITDKIIAVPTGSSQYRWMMMNIGRVRVTGIDLTAMLAVKPCRDLTLDATLTYTYQSARDRSDPSDTRDGGTYGGQIAYVPWHNGSVLAHAAWRWLELNYSFVYVGERYHTSANIPANHEQPWYTHDLALTAGHRLWNVDWRLTLAVNNVFNQQYDVIQNYPMPGRNFKITLRCDI